MKIKNIPKHNNILYNIQKQHDKDKNCNHVPKVTNHVCLEFEKEVLNECTQRILLKNKTEWAIYRKKENNTNQFSHRLIRECARDIHNREYWNEKNGSFIKKWQKEKLTCNLMFSNKWVSGFLRRENARRMDSIDNNNDHNNDIDIHIQSGDQVETMNITTSVEVCLAVDNGNDNITVNHCDDGDVKVSHCDDGHVKGCNCDDGNIKVSHCDDGNIKFSHCNDGNIKVSHCDDGNIKVSHCDDGDVKVSHCDDGNIKFSHCNDGNIKVSHCDDGNIKVSHCNGGDVKVSHSNDGNVKGCHDDGDGGNDCGEPVDDNNGPLAPYDDDLLREIIAFINGKGSL
jgi:hypothetical protein